MALYIKLDSTLCCMDLSLQLLQITKARKSLLANKNLHYLELPKYLYKHPLWGEPCFQQGFEPNGLLVSYSSVNKHMRILKQIEQCCTKITAMTKGNLDHSKVRKKTAKSWVTVVFTRVNSMLMWEIQYMGLSRKNPQPVFPTTE